MENSYLFLGDICIWRCSQECFTYARSASIKVREKPGKFPGKHHDHPLVCVRSSHLRPERKPAWDGLELTATASLRGLGSKGWTTKNSGKLFSIETTISFINKLIPRYYSLLNLLFLRSIFYLFFQIGAPVLSELWFGISVAMEDIEIRRVAPSVYVRPDLARHFVTHLLPVVSLQKTNFYKHDNIQGNKTNVWPVNNNSPFTRAS